MAAIPITSLHPDDGNHTDWYSLISLLDGQDTNHWHLRQAVWKLVQSGCSGRTWKKYSPLSMKSSCIAEISLTSLSRILQARPSLTHICLAVNIFLSPAAITWRTKSNLKICGVQKHNFVICRVEWSSSTSKTHLLKLGITFKAECCFHEENFQTSNFLPLWVEGENKAEAEGGPMHVPTNP